MAKLSLLDRMEFYVENRQWLSEGRYIHELKLVGADIYLSRNSSVWVCTESKKVTKLSEEDGKLVHFSMFNNKNGVFFLGTEGIFYKAAKKSLKKVYEFHSTIMGAKIMADKGVIILYHEGSHDIILQFDQDDSGEIVIIQEIECKVVFAGRKMSQCQTFVVVDKVRRIVTKEMEQYKTYTVGVQKKGLYEEPFKFESYEEAEKLLNGELAVAITPKGKREVQLNGTNIQETGN